MERHGNEFNMADLPVAVEIEIIEYLLQTGSRGKGLPSWVTNQLRTEFEVRPPGSTVRGPRIEDALDPSYRELDGMAEFMIPPGFDPKDYIPFVVRLKQIKEGVFSELQLDDHTSAEHLAGVLAKEWWKWGQEARTKRDTKRGGKQRRKKKRGKSTTKRKGARSRKKRSTKRKHPDGLVGRAEAQHHYQSQSACCTPILAGGYITPHDMTSECTGGHFAMCFPPICILIFCMAHISWATDPDPHFTDMINRNTAFVDALYLRDASPSPMHLSCCFCLHWLTSDSRKTSDFAFVREQSTSLARFLSSRLRHLRRHLSDSSSVDSYDYVTYDSYDSYDSYDGYN